MLLLPQVWQCPEGHIICGTCKARPELKTCPQCRMVLSGALSRNRVLEELARKTFQAKEEVNMNSGTDEINREVASMSGLGSCHGDDYIDWD